MLRYDIVCRGVRGARPFGLSFNKRKKFSPNQHSVLFRGEGQWFVAVVVSCRYRPKVLNSKMIEAVLPGRHCFNADFKAREGVARSDIQ